MKSWLENLAQSLHRHLYAISLLALAAVGTMLLSDIQTHWLEKLLTGDLPQKIGKVAGKIAVTIAFVAISYYVLREAFVTVKRKKMTLPAWFDGSAKYLVTVLRLIHPFIGVLVLVIVLFHGYVLWLIWDAGNFNPAVSSGLLAFSVLVIAALFGLCIRLLPKLQKIRVWHRLAGILFLFAFWLHKMFE